MSTITSPLNFKEQRPYKYVILHAKYGIIIDTIFFIFFKSDPCRTTLPLMSSTQMDVMMSRYEEWLVPLCLTCRTSIN